MIVACDNEWNIGKQGKLPWNHVKEDMALFKQMTTNGKNPGVLMGRKTWDSIPSIHRPLPDRVNIVLSNSISVLDDALVAADTIEALELAKETGIDTLWVIGGAKVYKEFLGIATDVFITLIDDVFENCDAKFPGNDFLGCYEMISERNYNTDNYSFKFQHWCWQKQPQRKRQKTRQQPLESTTQYQNN